MADEMPDGDVARAHDVVKDAEGTGGELMTSIEAERRRIAELSPEAAVGLYESIEAKRHTLDTMMWQTPALGLVAQSFLLVVALGPEYSWTARLIATTLGIVAALASIQLLLKHRYHEVLHAHWLEQFARECNLPGASPRRVVRFAFRADDHLWRSPPQPDTNDAGLELKLTLRRRLWHRLRRRLVEPSSVTVWVVALAIFGTAQASIFILGMIELLAGDSPL